MTRSSRARKAANTRWHGNQDTVPYTPEELKQLADSRVAIENAQPGGVTHKFVRKATK